MIIFRMAPENCIGILSYNKINLTKRCVDSVITSGYEPDSVFLFHNGSQLKVREELQQKYPKINHKWDDENRGYSGGFNSTMKWVFNCGARSVLFLTNDTIVDSATLINCLKTEKKIDSGFIAPSIFYLKYPDKIDSSGGFFDNKRFTLSHYHDFPLPVYLEPGKDYIPGTALWMREDVFKVTGGMDELFHTYWEDADLSFRCHNSGIKMARSPEAKIFHGIGQTCHKKPVYTTFYFQRNRILFCRKYLKDIELQKAVEIIIIEIEGMKKKAIERSDQRKLDLISELEKLF